MNNQDKFNEYRNKYDTFIYESYDVQFDKEYLYIKYHFNIPGLTKFTPEIKISRDYIRNDVVLSYVNYLVFQIGLIELISYVKCTCSKDIVI